MELKCKHCPFVAVSLLIDKEKAFPEVIMSFSKHLVEVHRNLHVKIMQDLAQVTVLASSIIVIGKHSSLLDKEFDPEDYITQKFNETLEKLEDHLGVEIMEMGGMEIEEVEESISQEPVPIPAVVQSPGEA